jgi:hypothetical protein
MKKLLYLIVLIVVLGLIVPGCDLLPVVPPVEQDETSSLTKGDPPDFFVDDDTCPGAGDGSEGSPFCSIQDAINAASASDTISVADGTYTITAAINVNKGVTITGNVANPENVLVKYDPASSTLNCVEVNSADVTIQGIKVQDCKNGFHFNRNVNTNTGVTILNCIIENVSGWGIGEISSPNTVISHNTITTAGDKGIYFRKCEGTSESNRCEAISNVISGCGAGQSAIQTYFSKYAYIYDNTISSTNDKGINIIRSGATGTADRIQVIGNTISETKWPGIQVIGSPYTYVYSNTLTECNYYGGDGTGDFDYASIHVQDDIGPTYSNHTIIDSNTVSDGINGIVIWSDNCDVTNNTIYNMGLTYLTNKPQAGSDGPWYNSAIVIGGLYQTDPNDPSGTTITGNNIHDNYWGLQHDPRRTNNVTATCNWWGSHDGPSGVGLGTGDAVSANVDFDPWIGITELSGPTYPVEIEALVSVNYSYTCDMSSATLYWGDGDADNLLYNSGIVDHEYSEAGVYTVTLTIENSCGSYSREFQYVVVYDPTGGFVTGGGWIDSPAGAYVPDSSAEGKASFGFVSKYKKGQTTPTGNTEFQFKAGNLNFHSDSYDWLVIAGAKAMYKGTGTINGMGEYKFMLSAIDADINENDSFGVDRFRIKIWDDTVIYDNQMDDADDADLTTEIGGGQIVIHKAK